MPSQPKLVLIYRPGGIGRLSRPWMAGWLHTEINVRHRELNQDTIAHLSTNRARRRLNSVDRSQRANHYARPQASELWDAISYQPKMLHLEVNFHCHIF